MLNLTPQERQVVLFLLTLALIGMGVNFLTKRYSTVKTLVCLAPDIGKADINKADRNTLMDLPGIGEKLAQRIIEYRQQQGGFKDIEELKNIKGVSDYKYEKLKELLLVK